MSLIERARSLRAGIEKLAVLEQAAQETGRFEGRRDALEKPAQELQTLVTAAEFMQARRITPDLNPGLVAALCTHLASLKQDYLVDPRSILEPPEELRYQFWTPLSQLPGAVRKALETAWTGYVRGRLPAVNDEVLLVLGNIPALQGQVRQIRAYLAEINKFQGRLPAGQDDFTALDRLVGELSNAWQGLQGGGIPADVLDFLRSAGAGGARLSDYTEVVRAWLEAHNLLGAFCIRPVGSQR